MVNKIKLVAQAAFVTRSITVARVSDFRRANKIAITLNGEVVGVIREANQPGDNWANYVSVGMDSIGVISEAQSCMSFKESIDWVRLCAVCYSEAKASQ